MLTVGVVIKTLVSIKGSFSYSQRKEWSIQTFPDRKLAQRSVPAFFISSVDGQTTPLTGLTFRFLLLYVFQEYYITLVGIE